MSEARRIVFLTPTYRPVGGVIKILDYLQHARALGYATTVWCPEPHDTQLPVFRIARFADLQDAHDVHFTDVLEIRSDDLVYFSWPAHYELLVPQLPRGFAPEQMIHIIQNVRHANPRWCDGYPLRLLSRPVARIMTNDVVMEAVAPHLNTSSPSVVIPLGHDIDYFHHERSSVFSRPIRVAYTTWKSSLGDEVAGAVDGSSFEFRAVREYVAWDVLRELYVWSDVFLCTPNPEEGFYMPGIEAMAAGSIVVTSDAGGNRAYCDFGRNCLLVGFEDPASYVAALEDLRDSPEERIEEMRGAGYETAWRHTLGSEADAFGEFLDELESLAF